MTCCASGRRSPTPSTLPTRFPRAPPTAGNTPRITQIPQQIHHKYGRRIVERGWCQGAAAETAAGDPVEPASPLARRWSATGALARVWRESGIDDEHGRTALQFANLALSAAVHYVPKLWNDAAGRRREEVLDAFARAVSLVQDPALFGGGNGNGEAGRAALARRELLIG